jgi:hypothetical protein
MTPIQVDGVEQYRDAYVVIPTQVIHTVTDPYALVVLLKLIAQHIGKGEQTLEEMAEVCLQSPRRFQESLRYLKAHGLIALSHERVTGRTRKKLTLTICDPSLRNTQNALQNTLPGVIVHSSEETNRKQATGQEKGIKEDPPTPSTYKEEWGKNAPKAVMTLFDQLQGIDTSIHKIDGKVYKIDAKFAAEIAALYTPDYVRMRWREIRKTMQNYEGRLSCRWLLSRLPDKAIRRDKDDGNSATKPSLFDD